MKVVGLLSGGKDSCYNLVHCVQQGHELVALATLAPPGSQDELDSYMYQTVGHDAVHLVASAMGLPLYRREIRGTAINQRSEYGSRTASSSATTTATTTGPHGEALDDETEDLYHLLLDVKRHHPEVDAVSVGAILSNYQRVRVEHVALRPDLGLTPLTFLWQRSQAALYAEMLEAGLVAILIKVAGIGLDERDLGRTLGEMRPKLDRLARMYGAHVCGEGGEYETLAIDSPLFRSRIDVRDVERVVHSDSGFGSVSYLRLKNAILVPKESSRELRASTPPLLDALGSRTHTAARTAHANASATPTAADTELADKAATMQLDRGVAWPSASVTSRGRWVVVSNVTGQAGRDVEEQVLEAFATVRRMLASHAPLLGMEQIAHVNLYVRTQAAFGRINAVYREQFGVSPPTRACVALADLPRGCDLVLNVLAFDDTGGERIFERRALHVQGRSFWAPANIGPYSQSLVVADKVWIAGQIGLVPADLCLSADETVQAALSIQHARRILTATINDMGGRAVERGWVEGGVCWIEHHPDSEQMHARLQMVSAAWSAQTDEDDEDQEEQEDEKDGGGEGWLGQTRAGAGVGLLMVTLAEGALPRGAVVEWQLTAHTGRIPSPIAPRPRDEDDDEDNVGTDAEDVHVSRTHRILPDGSYAVHTVTSSEATQSRFGLLTLHLAASSTAITAESDPTDASDDALGASLASLATAYAAHLYLPSTRSAPALAALHSLLPATMHHVLDRAQRVPCLALHTPSRTASAQPVDIALTWHGI